jgi:hypothetical protein
MTPVARTLACLALMGAPGVAFARTWTVNTSGTGDYTTIQGAINASSNGDTINVAAGTYTEAIDFGGKSITVQSTSGAASTTINASSTGTDFAVTFDDYEGITSVLDGFTIRNSGRRGVYVE